MRVFLDASAFLKVLKREEGYEGIVEWLMKIKDGEHSGYTDTIVIGEIAYAFLAQGLDEEAVKARAYIEGISNLTVVHEIPTSISHRAAELKKRYFKRSDGTFLSLYDAFHLAIAEKHCELLLTSDSDFRNVTEVKVEIV
ncbi:PIN domain-containing protein [Candidatus Bathyarchaeota archaeon]|nr:PIN domain-containing protein [Candidatus Bathyarchaeota archaeon]